MNAAAAELERQRLIAHLEMTGAWFIDEVTGLTPAQLAFRPAAGAGACDTNAVTLAGRLRAWRYAARTGERARELARGGA